MRRHQGGDLQAAEAGYRAVLAAAPSQADALHFLGLLLCQRGDYGEGVGKMRESLRLRPRAAGFHLNLGGVLEARGDLEAACEAYAEAARLEPDAADAHFNAGLLKLKLGRAAAAVTDLERAVALTPGDAESQYNLGRGLDMLGRWQEALEAHQAAVARAPRLAGAHAGAARALQRLGRLAEAAEACRRALELRPGDPALLNQLGSLRQAQGRPRDALLLFEAAFAAEPRAGIAASAARAALEAGETRSALTLARRAADLDADRAAGLGVLVSVLSVLRPDGADAALGRDFERVWSEAGCDPQPTARALARLLRQRLGLGTEPPGGEPGPASDLLLQRAAAEPLLHALLRRGLNVDTALEWHLRALRHGLLQRVAKEDGAGPEQPCLVTLCEALALQCFTNEYLWPVSPEEASLLEAAVPRLADQIRTASAPWSSPGFLCLAMYRPPAVLLESAAAAPGARPDGGPGVAPPCDDSARHAATAPAEGPGESLWRRAVLEPEAERRLARGLATLGPVRDDTSLAVRAQYEDNPYPRWVVQPQRPARTLASMLNARFPEHGGFEEFRSILVAGAGTGYEPIMLALGEPGAELTAIDLSLASLGHAERMRRLAGVENLAFVHGDLLSAPALARRFDLVVSSGVLHHLVDPLAGWRALREVLRPGGVMRIALYSRRAREPIARVRDELATAGVRWSREALHAVRRRILSAPATDPVSALARSDDLYATSAVRDLLFHACEHCTSPAGIARTLEAMRLEFLGMEVSDPALAARFRASTGEDPLTAGLDRWERFEQAHPDSFPGMLHFWCMAASDGRSGE